MHVATAPDGIRMIDITGETCPMTMVRTRLALDALPDGAALRVRLRGEEPRRSVPEACRMLGHDVSVETSAPDADDVTTLLVRKRPAAKARAAPARHA